MKLIATRSCLEADRPLQARVAVIGGGPSGSVCARELARRGHQVVLLERATRPRPRLGETCAPGLRGALEEGCGLTIPARLYRPLPAFRSAWGSEELDGRSFSFWHAADGFVLDRAAFDEWLLDAAREAGVTVLRGWSVESARRGTGAWEVCASAGGRERRLAAEFIVEASGRAGKSLVYSDAYRIFTDRLICLSVVSAAEGSEDSAAVIESCAGGWWYWVSLPDDRQLLALFTDADLVGPPATRAETLKSLLSSTRHMRRLGGQPRKDSTIRVSDARTSARRVMWRDSWLSIGDSAWSLDPLSGNGIQRAVRDGLKAAEAISELYDGGGAARLRLLALSMAKAFNDSLATQAAYYAQETRWRTSAFWRRRL